MLVIRFVDLLALYQMRHWSLKNPTVLLLVHESQNVWDCWCR